MTSLDGKDFSTVINTTRSSARLPHYGGCACLEVLQAVGHGAADESARVGAMMVPSGVVRSAMP